MIEKINAVIILFITVLPIVVAIIWITIEAIVWGIDKIRGIVIKYTQCFVQNNLSFPLLFSIQ